MLQFTHVSKIYQEKPVLDIEDLRLDRKIYWLQGVNGSGKTTLLSILAGLIPFNGDILLDGVNLRKDPLTYRRMVNFAEAEPLYPGFMSGSELVEFYRDIRQASTLQTDMLVNLFMMHRYLAMPISSYSGGMVKKLSLLLAFIGRPALILLDEPLAMLDENSIQVIPGLIDAYYKEFNTSFIFSSHQVFNSYSLSIHKIIIRNQSLQLVA